MKSYEIIELLSLVTAYLGLVYLIGYKFMAKRAWTIWSSRDQGSSAYYMCEWSGLFPLNGQLGTIGCDEAIFNIPLTFVAVCHKLRARRTYLLISSLCWPVKLLTNIFTLIIITIIVLIALLAGFLDYVNWKAEDAWDRMMGRSARPKHN